MRSTPFVQQSELRPKPAEPEPNRLMQCQTDPSAMRANLDDPPIPSAQFVPADAGSKDKNPMGSVLLSTPIIAPTNLDRHQILRNFCRESVRKGLRCHPADFEVGSERVQHAGWCNG